MVAVYRLVALGGLAKVRRRDAVDHRAGDSQHERAEGDGAHDTDRDLADGIKHVGDDRVALGHVGLDAYGPEGCHAPRENSLVEGVGHQVEGEDAHHHEDAGKAQDLGDLVGLLVAPDVPVDEGHEGAHQRDGDAPQHDVPEGLEVGVAGFAGCVVAGHVVLSSRCGLKPMCLVSTVSCSYRDSSPITAILYLKEQK